MNSKQNPMTQKNKNDADIVAEKFLKYDGSLEKSVVKKDVD